MFFVAACTADTSSNPSSAKPTLPPIAHLSSSRRFIASEVRFSGLDFNSSLELLLMDSIGNRAITVSELRSYLLLAFCPRLDRENAVISGSVDLHCGLLHSLISWKS